MIKMVLDCIDSIALARFCDAIVGKFEINILIPLHFWHVLEKGFKFLACSDQQFYIISQFALLKD